MIGLTLILVVTTAGEYASADDLLSRSDLPDRTHIVNTEPPATERSYHGDWRRSFRHPLQPVDQGVEDRGVLDRSFRLREPGLRLPSGFEEVYRVPGREDLFMRIDGALYAVFPASTYVDTRFGPVATIPLNTVFFVGPPSPADLERTFGPPRDVTARQRQQQQQDFDDLRVVDEAPPKRSPPLQAMLIPIESPDPNDDTAGVSKDSQVKSHASAGPPIFSDPEYRSRRFHELLRRAAEADSGARR